MDNSEVTNEKDLQNNYKLIGNKIGRVNIRATSTDGHEKNIWVNVVNNEEAVAAAKVANGNGFTVTLRADGTVWQFGNINGKNSPEKVEMPETIIDIAAGEKHVLLLGITGTVYSYGGNDNGQLGTGNTTGINKPVKLNLKEIEKVVAKSNTSFAINKDGKVYAWGESYTKLPSILEINKNVIDIGRTYYLADDGKVRTIADNEIIELSYNEYEPWEEPVIIEEKIVQMSEGKNHLLMLGVSGKIYSYGQNVYGQLGDNETLPRDSFVSTVVRVKEDGIIEEVEDSKQLPKLENVTEVSAGDEYSVAVTGTGKVYVWGINRYQTLGYSNELNENGHEEILYAVMKEDVTEAERVSAGYVHTSIYKEDGNVYTWGNGENGNLGNAENFNYYEAKLVGKDIIQSEKNQIIMKKYETLDIQAWVSYFNLFTEKQADLTYEVVDSDLAMIDSKTGRIMAMELGRTTIVVKENGTDKICVIPLLITENSYIEPMVETNGSHTIMLKVDGTVWCYGIGENGELGNGEKGISDEPVKAVFPNGIEIKQVACGENHCLALDKNGNVWSWGSNQYYQLGNTNEASVLTPTKVQGLNNIKKIACGTYNSFAVGSTGEVYSFGLNANGEGGVGTYTNKIPVTRAKNITDVIDIKAGKNHTVVLKSTGEVFASGSNLYGELGQNDGSIRKSKEFIKINNLNGIVMIACRKF